MLTTKKMLWATVITLSSLFANYNTAYAQCAMCKMPAESNLKNGGSNGSGLNMGILYMFLAPYLVVGTIGFLWWRGKQQHEEDLQSAEIQRVLDAAEQQLVD